MSEIENAVEVLNEFLAADPKAINALFSNIEDCNSSLADLVPVQVVQVEGGEKYGVRPIGILNGVVEKLTGKRIAVVYNDEPESKIIKFIAYT